MNPELLAAMQRMQVAISGARKRLDDKRIGCSVGEGKYNVVLVTFVKGKRTADVTTVRGGLSEAEAIDFLNTMTREDIGA
jgi:hypothetical protein